MQIIISHKLTQFALNAITNSPNIGMTIFLWDIIIIMNYMCSTIIKGISVEQKNIKLLPIVLFVVIVISIRSAITE